MDFGGFEDWDATRFCYLRVRVLQGLLQNDRVVDELLDKLDVPEQERSSRGLSRAA